MRFYLKTKQKLRAETAYACPDQRISPISFSIFKPGWLNILHLSQCKDKFNSECQLIEHEITLYRY